MPPKAAVLERPKLENITIYGAKLLFRNLAGRANPPYNEEGERSFAIVLEPDLAERLEQEGYNVKALRVSDEGQEPDKIIRVKVNFNSERPPRIVVISGNTRTQVTKENEAILGPLDYADISNVDLTLNPYAWTMHGNSGVSAYLKGMYITLAVDELDRKYEEEQVPPTTTESSSTASDSGRTGIIDLSEFDRGNDDVHPSQIDNVPMALEED